MTEKRLFGTVKGHREHIVDNTGRLYSDGEVADLLNEQHETIEELTSNTIEDNIEINHINTIYEELGFDGVIEYAKDKLSKYGAVREIEKGLWLLATGGWSDHEHWISCLKDSVMSWKGHYMASTRGGGFYYTKKPYDDIEIRLKGDD